MIEFPLREPNPRLAGPGRQVSVAGVLALTEPGPAAAGVVIADQRGRALARRAQYLGQASRGEATAQALLWGLRMAAANALEEPVVRVEDAALADALMADRPFPDDAASLGSALREAAAQLPGLRIEAVNPATNPARPVALAPLVEWLPERTRKAEELHVRPLGDGEYAVESASQPGRSYRVTLRLPEAGERQAMQCECADFQYRGIPCKHLLAVARDTGALQRLFYADGEKGEGIAPRGRAE
jgi:hypothetical protein